MSKTLYEDNNLRLSSDGKLEVKILSSALVEVSLTKAREQLESKGDRESLKILENACENLFHPIVLGNVTWPVVLTGSKQKLKDIDWVKTIRKYQKIKETADRAPEELFNVLTAIENIDIDAGNHFLEPLKKWLPKNYDIVETESGIDVTKHGKGNSNETIFLLTKPMKVENIIRHISDCHHPEKSYAEEPNSGMLHVLNKKEFKRFVSKTKKGLRRIVNDEKVRERSRKIVEGRLSYLNQTIRMLTPSLNLSHGYGIYSFGSNPIYPVYTYETEKGSLLRKLKSRKGLSALTFGLVSALGAFGIYYYLAQPAPKDRISEKLSSIKGDRYTYDLIMGFSDSFSEGDVNDLMNNFGRDYNLTFRSLVAADYLKNSAKSINSSVVGNLTVVNDAVDFILRHRDMNNGMDDPSGFASVPDLIKLMYYRCSPGYVELLNGTKVTRKTLSDAHVNATLAFADNSRLVLPTIGDTVIPHEVICDNPGLSPKNYPIVTYAPYSQNVSNDPRFSFYPFDNRSVGGIINGTSFGIWGEAFDKYVNQGYSEQDAAILANEEVFPVAKEWIKAIEIVPTRAARDLEALSNGHLNETQYRYSYKPQERQHDLAEGDRFLVYHGERVDNTPIVLRPFTLFENSGLESLYEGHGVIDGMLSYSDKAFRDKREELLPNYEDVLFFATGVQYILDLRLTNDTINGVKATHESIGLVIPRNPVNPDGWYSNFPYPRHHLEYFHDGGKIIVAGEPVFIPAYDYPFVDVNKTREFWLDLPIEDPYKGKTYGKCYLLLPNMIDEGNPWLKVFDNTDDL